MPAIAIAQPRRTAAPAVPTVPAAAADALRPLLAGPLRPGQVVALHRRAVLIRCQDQVQALVFGTGSLAPNTMTVAAQRPPVTVGAPVLLGDGAVQLPGSTARIRRWWPTRVPRIRLCGERLAVLGRVLAGGRPGLSGDRVAGFARALALTPPARTEAARSLLGLGPGSTPAGDDLLCGTMSGLFAGGRPDLAAALLDGLPDRYTATTGLSATLLDLAAAGHATVEALAVLRAMDPRGPDPESVIPTLLALGHTSGTDLATGLWIGLTHLLQEESTR